MSISTTADNRPPSTTSSYSTASETDDDMASFERSQRFNRESVKVNIGLPPYTAPPRDDTDATTKEKDKTTEGKDTTSAWASNQPPTTIDFSLFTVPSMSTSALAAPLQAQTLRNTLKISPFVPVDPSAVDRLRHPPKHAFVHGVLSINWVIGAVGREHFVLRKTDGRLVLKPRSDLRLSEWELKGALVGWLKGDEGGSATEDGVMLTRDFFDKEG